MSVRTFGGVDADALRHDLDRKHRECAERERQVSVMAEEIERLRAENLILEQRIKTLEAKLSAWVCVKLDDKDAKNEALRQD